MKSEVFRSKKLGTLTGEYEQAAVDLRETRDEWEDRRSCHRRADFLEVRQEGRRAEHARLQMSKADFEQRYGFMWSRGSCERSLRSGREELRKGDQLFIEGDRGLAGVRLQFAELQSLFDEVSHQLYTECKRIEGVLETVNACAKQSKELEAIHHKLEESHQMLTQMFVTRAWREDQDSEAPETRPTAYSSLT